METIDNGNKIKLSIIIPYFETYELTERLLKNLSINQTQEVEILLLDDGCRETRLDRFANNIRIIHQDNMGVARTRNKGIELAQGKYIALIDCDDQVTSDYIETLLNAIDEYNTDIINFNWADLTQNVIVRKPDNYAPWKAIYKKETMPRFVEFREYGAEDVDFQGELAEGIRTGKYTITYLDRLLYLYNSNREGSLFWKKIHQED